MLFGGLAAQTSQTGSGFTRNAIQEWSCSRKMIAFKSYSLYGRMNTKDIERWYNTETPLCKARGVNDQRSLSIAVAKSSVRPVHLAEYLNYALFTSIITYSPPVVYHGRFPEMEKLDSVISSNWDNAQDYAPRLLATKYTWNIAQRHSQALRPSFGVGTSPASNIQFDEV